MTPGLGVFLKAADLSFLRIDELAPQNVDCEFLIRPFKS